MQPQLVDYNVMRERQLDVPNACRLSSMVKMSNIRRPSAIRSGTTTNNLLSALTRTRKVINNIVKPRPSFEVPRSYIGPRRPFVVSPGAKISPMSSKNGWGTVNPLIPESNKFECKSGSLNATSIDSVHVLNPDGRFCHDHRNVIGTTGRVHTLRRTKGSIRSITRGHNAANSGSISLPESHHLIESHTRSPPRQSGPRRLSPILEQRDSPDPGTGMSNCTNALLRSSVDSAIHFVDEDYGTIFSRVQRASGSCIPVEQSVLEHSSLKSSQSLHIGNPPACSATELDAHIESPPSFVLMLPTPMSPHSPIFSPGVHPTSEKFLDPAKAAARKDRAPTVPQCDHGQGGKLCRSCEMQLLVWFQNADDRARVALHVRPAQSTRAMFTSLGVGAGCPSGIGLGFANGLGGSDGARDGDDDDIDDPGTLAIEAPPVASPGLVPLAQAISWSTAVLSKLRVRLRALSLPLSTTPTYNRRRKRRGA